MLYTYTMCYRDWPRAQGSLPETMGQAGCWLSEILRQWKGNNLCNVSSSFSRNTPHRVTRSLNVFIALSWAHVLTVMTSGNNMLLWLCVEGCVLQRHHLHSIYQLCEQHSRAEVWGCHEQSNFHLQSWKRRFVFVHSSLYSFDGKL